MCTCGLLFNPWRHEEKVCECEAESEKDVEVDVEFE